MHKPLVEQEDEVRRANRDFYRAMEARDLEAMRGLWATDLQVLCVPTGRDPAVGWPAVREYWRGLFDRLKYLEIEAVDVSVTVIDRTALVVCVERAFFSTGGETQRTSIHATNLYYLAGDRWRLVHHHGSPPGFRD